MFGRSHSSSKKWSNWQNTLSLLVQYLTSLSSQYKIYLKSKQKCDIFVVKSILLKCDVCCEQTWLHDNQFINFHNTKVNGPTIVSTVHQCISILFFFNILVRVFIYITHMSHFQQFTCDKINLTIKSYCFWWQWSIHGTRSLYFVSGVLMCWRKFTRGVRCYNVFYMFYDLPTFVYYYNI